MENRRIELSSREIPEAWYNLAADLPEPMPPHRHPATGQPVTPEDMGAIFPPALIEQEVSHAALDRDPRRRCASSWRSGGRRRWCGRATWRRHLGTPARIYFKNESVSPAGSHKPNTAVAQVYYNKLAGIARLATETGAGQWGIEPGVRLRPVRPDSARSTW